MREKSLKGQVVLITGGGGGIGRLMALKFAKEGVAMVVLWDLDLAAAERVVKEIEQQGGKATAYKVDVSNREIVYATGKEVLDKFGSVDVLVNNAGIVSGKKIFEADDARSAKTIEINTTALLWTAKAFVPAMIAKKRGHIVTIASSAGRVGVAGMVDYCASKYGAVGFDESLRNELRVLCPEVRTTCVCPGYIDTGMFKGARMQSTIPFLTPLTSMLLPVLKPEYVAAKIVTAVKRNQTVLVMPKFGYLSVLFRALTPTNVFDTSMDILGVTRSMDHFEQTRL